MFTRLAVNLSRRRFRVAGMAANTNTTAPQPAQQPVPPAIVGTGGAGEMCRLTIVGPTSRVELAVPAHVPIVDLMPTVLGHLDPSLATTGLGHGGWVLQRLGEPPVDEDHGTAAAGLFDGDVLHLRPRDDQLPLADFDDLVDGVHSGLSGHTDTWRPAMTRRACLAIAALCGMLAVLVTTFGSTGTTMALATGLVGVLLLGGASAMARFAGDPGAAIVLAAVGITAIGVAATAVPSGDADLAHFTGPRVLAAAAAVAVATALARAALGVARPAFLAVTVGAVLVVLAGVLGVFVGFEAPATAAVLVVFVLATSRVTPQLSAWLAGLVAEPVPTTPEEFQQGLDPLPSKDVLDRAAVADAHLTAFNVVFGLLITGALVVVTSASRWDAATLTSVVAMLLLLQARELSGTWHRLASMVPAIAALVALVLGLTRELSEFWQLCVAIGLIVVTGNAVAGAQLLPGRRLVPRWGRLGDVLHWFCSLAVISLVLSLTGFYALVVTWL
jgi:type VII secretion integral membrane protein EccD